MSGLRFLLRRLLQFCTVIRIRAHLQSLLKTMGPLEDAPLPLKIDAYGR